MSKNRDYFFFFVIVSILIFGYLFLQEGVIIQRDFNFPIFTESFIRYHYPLWNDLTSQSNLEQLIRLVPRMPYIVMAYFGLNVEIILKLMPLITYIGVSFFMFIFLRELFNRLKLKQANLLIFPLVISSLFFSYSPPSMQFFWEISLILSVGVLPLLLFLILKYSEKSYKKFVILFSLTLLLSVGHPFVLVMNLIISFLFSLVVLKSNIVRELKNFSLVMICFGALFLWFILPYVSSGLKSSVDLGRSSNVERNTFEEVSNNNLAKILSSERDKFVYIKTSPENEVLQAVHNFSLYGVLLVSFLAFLVIKQKANMQLNKVIWFSSIGFLSTTLFAFGQKSLIGDLYWWFIDTAPIGWIFRSPLKFQLYQVFFLSILLAFSTYFILDKCKHIKLVNVKSGIFLSIFFSLLVIGSTIFGIVDANINSMNPIQIPSPYYEITDLLKEDANSYKVLWYPRYGETATAWSEGHMIGPFDMKSSIQPTYNTNWNYNYIVENLYDIPYTANLFSRDNFYNYLTALGVGYVVFHNDRYYSIDDEVLSSMKQHMSLVYENKGWYLFKLSKIPNEIFSVSNCTILSNQILIPEHIDCPLVKNLHKDNKFEFVDLFEKENLLMNRDIFSSLPISDAVLPPRSIKEAEGWKFTQKIGAWLTILRTQQKELGASYSDFTTRKGVFYTNAPSILPKLNFSDDIPFLSVQDPKDMSLGWKTNLSEEHQMYINEFEGGFIIKLLTSSEGWKTIKSKLIPLQYDEYSKLNFSIKATNASSVHAKIFEYDINGRQIGNEFGEIIEVLGNGTFAWRDESLMLTPNNIETSFVQIQIWFEDNIDPVSQVEIEMKDFSLYNLNEYREQNLMEFPFTIDEDGAYLFFVRYLKNENGGDFDLLIDGNSLVTIESREKTNRFNWSQKIPVVLDKGNHIMAIKNNIGFNAIDKISMTTENEFDSVIGDFNQMIEGVKIIDLTKYNDSNKSTLGLDGSLGDLAPVIMATEKISPTKYKITVDTKQPFLLSFTESFDSSWTATVNKNVYKSEELYSTINGFWIEDIGIQDIVLEYNPQKLFSIGLLISSITLLGCVRYLAYDWQKRRKLIITKTDSHENN